MLFDCHVLFHRRTLTFLHARLSFHGLGIDSLEFRCLIELFIGSLCPLCHCLRRVTAVHRRVTSHVLRVVDPSLSPSRRAVFRASPPGAGIPKIVRKWRQSRVPRCPLPGAKGGGRGHTLPSSPKHPLPDTAWGGRGAPDTPGCRTPEITGPAPHTRTHTYVHTHTCAHSRTHSYLAGPSPLLRCSHSRGAPRGRGGAGRRGVTGDGGGATGEAGGVSCT